MTFPMKLWMILLALFAGTTNSSAGTIVSLTTNSGGLWGYSPSSITNVFSLLLFPGTYTLANGDSWPSGAGAASSYAFDVALGGVDGALVNYTLTPTNAEDWAVQFGSADSGSQCTNGVFGVTGPLTLVATSGSQFATVTGSLILLQQTVTTGCNFDPFAATVGSLVPFSDTFQIYTDIQGTPGEWSSTSFDAPFDYSASGEVSFVPEHPAVLLCSVGLAVLGFLWKVRLRLPNSR